MNEYPGAAAADENVRRIRAQQASLYGAPLNELIVEITDTYAITRRRLASVLGVSPAMITQVAAGNRIKLGNPGAVQRMQRLLENATNVRTGRVTPEVALAQIEAEQSGSVLTQTSERLPRQGAQDVQLVLRWAASADDLARAADLLDADFPHLAQVMRVYGTGRSADAAAHFASIVSA